MKPNTPIPLDEPIPFGRYQLIAELASGGMGTVYAARQIDKTGFSKLLALKQIHAHLAKERRFVKMFLDEANLAARIDHANVCGVVDFGEVEGSYYLAMPYVYGASLSRVRKAVVNETGEGKLKVVRLAARALADACEGLHAAHELRDESGASLEVVHRDVSPSNLLLGFDGVARVIDFGVASARDKSYSTVTGEVKGKLGYASPEQLSSGRVDRRADIWSMGVILWELLTGRYLFRRNSMGETVMAVTQSPIPSARELWPEAPLGLEEVVFKALSRDRERRFATAREMGREIIFALSEDGPPPMPADLAEWMEELFPEEERGQRELLEASFSKARIVSERPAKTRSTRRTFLMAIGGGLALGAGVGATAWFLRDESSELGDGRENSTSLPENTGLGTSALDASPPDASTPDASAPDAPSQDASDSLASSADSQDASMEVREDAGSQDASARDASAPDASPPEDAAAIPEPSPMQDRPNMRRGSGSLRVIVPGGWAYVYLGSRRLGEAPGTFRLPAGLHRVRIQPGGQGTGVTRRVRIRAGGETRISVRP